MAWHKIPQDIDVEHLNIKRIRYVKEWGLKITPEDAFIIEFDSHKDLLGRSELGLTAKEFASSIKTQNNNGLLYGMNILLFGECSTVFLMIPMIMKRMENMGEIITKVSLKSMS